MSEKTKKKLNIKIPGYSLGEELFNAISHGLGAVLSITALVLMVVRAHGVQAEITVSLFGAAMIILYTISCIYHALSHNLEGKKVLRVIDHCNVFLLVMGTYIPVSLMGVGGALGWVLLGIVVAFGATGITFTAIGVDQFRVLPIVCHLVCGWSILFGISRLLDTMGSRGVLVLLLGGIMYTLGSILYGIGTKKRCIHCVFHIFCMLGTFFHFWGVYQYLL